MNYLDIIAYAILATFWFFGIAPLMCSQNQSPYKNSLMASLLIQVLFVVLCIVFIALGWVVERVTP